MFTQAEDPLRSPILLPMAALLAALFTAHGAAHAQGHLVEAGVVLQVLGRLEFVQPLREPPGRLFGRRRKRRREPEQAQARGAVDLPDPS